MAIHHFLAIILFLFLAHYLPSIWSDMHPLYMYPFMIHALYWTTIRLLPTSANNQLLAVYNLALATASCHARKYPKLLIVANIACAVVVVNYWTYCWEFKGIWCMHSSSENDIMSLSNNVADLVVNEVERYEELDWQVGLLNLWYGTAMIMIGTNFHFYSV